MLRRYDLGIDDPALLALLDRLPIAAACVDDAGTVTFINVRAREASGYTREDIPTLAAWRQRAFPDPGYRAQLATRWDAAVARAAAASAAGGDGDIGSLDITLVTGHGETREATIFGLALRGGFLALFLDRTERNRAEAQRRLLEQRFRDIVEATGEYVWECDSEARYVYLSDKVLEIFGWSPQEMLGRKPSEFMPPGEREAVAGQVRALIELSGSFRGLEHRSVTRSGRVIWQLVNSVAIHDEHGRIVGYRGTGRDITARKQAEAEREQLGQQVREAQRLQALGTFAGGVAHEFNNLLAVILGHSALARRDPGLADATRGHIEALEEAACEARDLVMQLLAIGRQQPRSVVRVALVPLVRECLRLFEASRPAGVTLEFAAPADETVVAGDPAQLRQMLLNLGLNAMQAMEGRPGRIEIRLESVQLGDEAPAIHQRLRPGRHACLSITDQGHGMDTATLQRIFEPFFTTKPTGQGTGLGLSVVDGIAHSHAGAVVAQSRAGCGSKFSVYLPQVAD